MTLINVETDLDQHGVTRMSVRRDVLPPVAKRLDVTTDEWTWRELRDYVEAELQSRGGPMERSGEFRDVGIYKGFIKRWGSERARKIARAAFELYEGRWGGAPITVTRFCQGNDPFFGSVIAERLGLNA